MHSRDGSSNLPYSYLIFGQETKGAFTLKQIASPVFLK
jgi:hypothetical protein